jgi:cellulase/cellobiase CelA1
MSASRPTVFPAFRALTFALGTLTALAILLSPGPGARAATIPTRTPTTTPTCSASNGSVLWRTTTSIAFSIPGSTCVPQAIFFVSLFTTEADARANTPVAASGTGSRESGSVVVIGLTPGTAYWYRFQMPAPAPVAGPVLTLPSATTGPSPSAEPAGCSATYRVLSRWPDGYLGEVTVTAGPRAVTDWVVAWPATGRGITQSWGAEVTEAGGGVRATGLSWNRTLSAGASTSFGVLGRADPDADPDAVPQPTCSAR